MRALTAASDPVPAPVERPVRWQPNRRAVVAMVVLVVVVGAISLAWVFTSRPQPLTVQDNPVTATSTAAPSTVPSGASGGTGGEVVVDVAGKVKHPGLYHLKPGSRVDDALKVAGGALRGVSTLNLNRAAKLTDGEQIVVGLDAAAAPAPAGSAGAAAVGGAGAAAAGGTGKVSLNTADLAALDALPGVGPVLAQHILDWRTTHGSFSKVDQLQDVSGIGPSKYAALKDLVAP